VSRFSFNQATAKYWPLADVVAGCASAGVTNVGLWREPVAEYGLTRSAKLVREAGLSVTSLCRGGFFGADNWLDDNRAALDEAAELGAPALVLVCGGLFGRTLDQARDRVARGLEALAPHALDVGVTLAVEPMHPMFCADRCVVSTLGDALDLALQFPAETVGVVVDTYHVWWDPQLAAQIERARGRIVSVQLCDWVIPLPADTLLGRGHLGDGVIDFPPVVAGVLSAGYTGFVEIEIFNQDVWDAPADQTAATIRQRFASLLA